MSWQTVELGSIANFINGFAFKPAHWGEKGKPIIRIQNLTDDSKPFNYSTINVAEKYHVTKGDLLVSWSATLDVFEWVKEDALLNQHIFKVVPDYERVDKNYLRLALRGAIESMMKFTRGSTMKHVNRGDFLGTNIPLPPLPVQKQIAAVLEKADTLRSQCQQMEQELNSLAQSVFLDMFGDPVTNPKGWPKSKLGENLTIKHGFAFKSEFFTSEGEYVLLTPGNFFEEGGYRDRLGKQKFYMGEIPDGYILNEGDLLVAMTEQAEGLLGSCIQIPASNKYLHNQRLGLVELKTNQNKYFITSLFNSKSIRKAIQSTATGIKVKHTSPSKLEAIEVGLPPIELQQRFEKFVTNISKQSENVILQKSELEQQFNSLMQRAFKGELELKDVA